ncbi:MAG: hypothetical protein ACI32N_07840 [Bulleidia sp.]
MLIHIQPALKMGGCIPDWKMQKTEGVKKTMKKSGICIMSLIMTMTGCAQIDSGIEGFIFRKSGIEENTDYQNYKQMKESGQLDEEGYYISQEMNHDTDEDTIDHEGKVRVSFGSNNYLTVSYFSDEDLKEKLPDKKCYVEPGDTIYAKLMKNNNTNSNMYCLSEYQIIEFDHDGSVSEKYSMTPEGDVMKLEIPKDFNGSGISIMPIGSYPDRTIEMKVYFVDENGNTCTLLDAGTWYNGKKLLNSDSAQFSPTESYSLRYEFDRENYFFVSCSPSPLTENPQDLGSISFKEAAPTDANTMYTVQLHRYLTLTIKVTEDAEVKVNQSEPITIKKNSEWTSNKLKYGDIVSVDTNGDCEITDGDYRYVTTDTTPVNSQNRYTFKVNNEARENVSSDSSPVKINHVFEVGLITTGKYGTATYRLDGKEVTGTVQIKENQKLTLTYKITDKNYRFRDGSEGIGGFFHDLVAANERTVTIPITADRDQAPVYPDDWFDIVKKGE